MGPGGTPKGREARRRRSLRLRGHDYAASGGYFVTICSRGRACLFGGIDDGAICLSPIGEIVSGCWLEIPQHFPDAELDEWIVMPNHIHGILILHGRGEAFASRRSSAPQDPGANASPLRITKARGTRRNSLGAIIQTYKSVSSRRVNATCGTPGSSVWQRNYFEHLIRNDEQLTRTRRYIVENPLRWELDEENPQSGVPLSGA